MSVVAKKRSRGVVYFVVFTWQGKRVWERSGADRREAERLDKQRQREVRDGTYVPEGVRRRTTFGQWAAAWSDQRTGRSADSERGWLDSYVLVPEREWLTSMAIDDVRPRHILQLVNELGKVTGKATGRPLTPKSIANVYGIVRTMLRDARIKELIREDPCVLPRGTIRRGRTKRRDPYSAAEFLTLTSDDRIPPDARIFNALALYTGMREGEVCGRRWRDLDRGPRPLGCLTVDSQYDGQPLKTDKAGDEHPRRVPVHPELARALDAWWREGFEFVCCRAPTADDFIVPRRDGGSHTRSSAYKMFRRACKTAGVPNRSLHATRHTFISLARRGGARKDVLERVTHNASGDIVDAYTRWDWGSLCEAVECLRLDLDDGGGTGGWPAPRSTSGSGNDAGRVGTAIAGSTQKHTAYEAVPSSVVGSIPGASTTELGIPRASSTNRLRIAPEHGGGDSAVDSDTRRELAGLARAVRALGVLHPELDEDEGPALDPGHERLGS